MLLKPICACYLSRCVVFILENRQSFTSKRHRIKVSSVNCHSKDVDSCDCDLCTLVSSELFEMGVHDESSPFGRFGARFKSVAESSCNKVFLHLSKNAYQNCLTEQFRCNC